MYLIRVHTNPNFILKRNCIIIKLGIKLYNYTYNVWCKSYCLNLIVKYL